jgi:hypothetical protein
MLAYCDQIASMVRRDLAGSREPNDMPLVVGHINYDLHPTEHYLMTTKKTISVWDINRKQYRITIEEVDDNG